MTDWRLREQEEYLEGVHLTKKIPTEFWEESYATKNDFYQKLLSEPIQFVKQHGRGGEYLEGDKLREFWHEHFLLVYNRHAHARRVLLHGRLLLLDLQRVLQ